MLLLRTTRLGQLLLGTARSLLGLRVAWLMQLRLRVAGLLKLGLRVRTKGSRTRLSILWLIDLNIAATKLLLLLRLRALQRALLLGPAGLREDGLLLWAAGLLEVGLLLGAAV